LLWFSTYKGRSKAYTFQIQQSKSRGSRFSCASREGSGVRRAEIAFNGAPLKITIGGTEASAEAHVGREPLDNQDGIQVAGMDSWSYQLSAGEGVARINDFIW